MTTRELTNDLGEVVNFAPVHAKFDALYAPYRYKIFHSGRGAAKSWEFARALVWYAIKYNTRILCCREIQNSIKESSYKLIKDTIIRLGFESIFSFQRDVIENKLTGAHFIFAGLWNNEQNLKSTEAVDIAWVEEGQSTSRYSWQTLDPTVRSNGEKPWQTSEVWVSMNPFSEDDVFYSDFVTGINPDDNDKIIKPAPKSTFVTKVSWRNNPYFFGSPLYEQMMYMKKWDYDTYLHVWEGNPRTNSSAAILADRVEICEFGSPEWGINEYFYGADWGFARDPTCIIRMFERDDCLFIDYESYKTRVETSDLPAMFSEIPNAHRSLIYADNARPENISHVRRNGFPRLLPCEKWAGSIEDGISHLRCYKKIYIHTRCPNTARDFKKYSFDVDKKTGKVTNKILDTFNHATDAARYGLERRVRAFSRSSERTGVYI